MQFLSVCSGIEAASVAWGPLGFEALAVSEIDKFPSAVLAHHYPQVPNLGDMLAFKDWPNYEPDILVGGTPCQSFSVAGLRKGLADPRGNLMLTYLAIADRYQPEWIVWENVPGVLSSGGGRDFGTFLGALGALGYGWAYRTLDAQFFGVPQRRRRVFVVGCLGGWQRAAAVLFERHSLQRHPAPRREAGQEVTPTIRAGAPNGGPSHGQRSGDTRDELIIPVAATLEASVGRSGGTGINPGLTIPVSYAREVAHSVTCHMVKGGDTTTTTTDNYVAFDARQDCVSSSSVFGSLGSSSPQSQAVGYMPARSFGADGGIDSRYAERPICDALHTSSGGGNKAPLIASMAVRRLTPRECERLQGFPDDYTLVPHRNKPAADGPRYKALGNSMAVPVMRWIGERIQLVDWLLE